MGKKKKSFFENSLASSGLQTIQIYEQNDQCKTKQLVTTTILSAQIYLFVTIKNRTKYIHKILRVFEFLYSLMTLTKLYITKCTLTCQSEILYRSISRLILVTQITTTNHHTITRYPSLHALCYTHSCFLYSLHSACIKISPP